MLKIMFFLLLFSNLLVVNAYAYIDFGTGSYVLQILATSVIGFIFLIKNYLQNIKLFFKRKPPTEDDIAKDSKEQE